MSTPDRLTRIHGLRTAERYGVTGPEARTAPTPAGAPVAARPEANDHDHALRDRIRWRPVRAGTVVVLTTVVVLQLLSVALGRLDLGFDAGGSAAAAGIISILAFVGGLTAAASTMWRGTSDGILQDVLAWGIAVVLILALTLLISTAVLGLLSDVRARTRGAATRPVDPAQLVSTARRAAGWAGLELGVGAAALGGMSGSAPWSSRRGEGART